jgi:outer membrane lipoprotein SlyB
MVFVSNSIEWIFIMDLNKKVISVLLTSVALASTMVGCASTSGTNAYSRADVGQVTEVEFGTVLNSRQVLVNGTQSGVGTLAGGGTGAILGSHLGGGSGRAIGAIGVGVLGGIIGSKVEEKLTEKQGVEYVVTKEDGRTVTITQYLEKNEVPIANGSRVMIQRDGRYQRVILANQLPTVIDKPQSVKVKGVTPPQVDRIERDVTIRVRNR